MPQANPLQRRDPLAAGRGRTGGGEAEAGTGKMNSCRWISIACQVCITYQVKDMGTTTSMPRSEEQCCDNGLGSNTKL